MYTSKNIYDGLIFNNEKGMGRRYQVRLKPSKPDYIVLKGLDDGSTYELYKMASIVKLLNDGTYVEQIVENKVVNNYSIF